MNVSLTPELEGLVREKVESGMYQTASEVVREALRLLRDRDEDRQQRLEDLRREIQVGIDAIERGEYQEFSSTDEILQAIRKHAAPTSEAA